MWEHRWYTDIALYSIDSHGNQTGQINEDLSKGIILISEIIEDIAFMKQQQDSIKNLINNKHCD